MNQEKNMVNLRVPDSLIETIKREERNIALAPTKRKRLKPLYRRRFVTRVILASLLVIVFALASWVLLAYDNALEVYAADELVGLVRMDRALSPEYLVEQLTNKLEEDNQAQVRISDSISLNPVFTMNAEMLDGDALLIELSRSMQYEVQASAFVVDGETIAILKNDVEALTVRDNIFAKYTPRYRDIEEVSFIENVSIEDIFVEKSEIITLSNAIEILTAESVQQAIYTVEKDDVLGTIAEKNMMTLNALLAVNPGISSESTLSVGQQLNIEVSTPLLSVQTIEIVVVDEVASAPMKQHVNPLVETTRLLQEGRDGSQRVRKRVTRVNGFIQSEEVLSSVYLEEPIPQIIEIPPQ